MLYLLHEEPIWELILFSSMTFIDILHAIDLRNFTTKSTSSVPMPWWQLVCDEKTVTP